MRFQADLGARRLLTVAIAGVGILLTVPLLWLSLAFSLWFLLPTALIAIAATMVARVYPRRFAATLHGTFDSRAVTVYSGVWWKREIRLPLSQLRTFECWTLPFGQLFDCSVVVLRFAGGSICIPLIPREQADRLTRLLSEGPS